MGVAYDYDSKGISNVSARIRSLYNPASPQMAPNYYCPGRPGLRTHWLLFSQRLDLAVEGSDDRSNDRVLLRVHPLSLLGGFLSTTEPT